MSKPKQLPQFRKGKKAESDFGPIVIEEARREDPRLAELARQLGSLDRAKRVLKLQEQYPNGTIPELIVMDYLNRNGEQYLYQLQAFGGRGEVAGQGFVPDFLVWHDRSRGTVIQVQGFYYHSAPEKRERDAANKMRLMGNWFAGVRVTQVVDVWDLDLLSGNADNVIEMALLGHEIQR